MALEQIYLRTLEMESSKATEAELDEHFLRYLSWLGKTTEKSGSLSELGMSSDEQISLYTRMANCVITWVCCRDEAPSLEVIHLLANQKTLIWSIFQASAYAGQSILTERIAQYVFGTAGGDLNLASSSISDGHLTRLLSVISINDASDATIRTALSQDREKSFAFWLGWTAERIRVTERALNAESLLLAFTENREPVVLPKALLGTATCAYMYFTYMVHERKHDMKAYLNRCFAKTLDSIGLIVPELPEDRVARDKPKMVIPLERFTSGHAMHRCYAEYIAWLGEEFETIALVNSKDIDEQSGAIFSRVIHKEPNWNIQDVVNIVAMESPDIIYFPSIGMSTWTILMSNIRLAPVQVMTLGHPATSTSKNIDYVIVSGSDQLPDQQPFFTERVIYTPTIDSRKPWCSFLPNIKVSDRCLPFDELNVDRMSVAGVNAKIMKLNSVFLKALLQVDSAYQEACGKNLMIKFFPAEKGIGFDGFQSYIRKNFKLVKVEPYLNYSEFMQSLAQVDTCYIPFPFGNTNSTVDALLLNKPTIFLKSSEPSMAADLMVSERLGFFDLMAVDRVSSYVKIGVALLTNSGERNRWKEAFQNFNMLGLLTETNDQTELDCKNFTAIFKNYT